MSTCNECGGKSRKLAPAHSALLESSPSALDAGKTGHAGENVRQSRIPGHDFGQLPIYPGQGGTGDTLFINGPDKDAPKTPPKEKTPPAKEKPPAATPDCPTDVQLINLDQITDPGFGKNGWKTGYGAVAYMEVSGPGRKDWDGIKIEENVKQIKNTCGARARKVCSNTSGESEYELGKGISVLGQTKMPALANTFYDMHIFASKEFSLLHEKDLPDCQIQCEQSFKCGGKQIGSEFIITYNATKDTIAKTYDVTRIKVDKSPKAAPATTPPKP